MDQTKFFRELKALISPLTPLTNLTDISNLDSHLSDSIISALNSASPNRTKSHKDKVWWNPNIMGPLSRAAATALKKSKTHPSDENRAIYCSTRNKYFQTIETEKTISWRKYLSTLTVDTLFQAKRYSAGPKPSPIIGTLIDKEGRRLITNQNKAEALFKATCVATTACDTSDMPIKTFPKQVDPTAKYFDTPISYFTKSLIRESLNETNPMKAPGPDSIQNWVWALAWDVVHKHVIQLFEAIIVQGHIPPQWKMAKTVMLAKPGKSDYTQPGAYRPITLLNTLAKLFEKTLARYMSNVAEQYQVLHPGHFGARPNHSSQEALIQLVTWIKSQWRAGRMVGEIFADVKSVFPSVHHPRMIHTLENQGYPPPPTDQSHPEFLS